MLSKRQTLRRRADRRVKDTVCRLFLCNIKITKSGKSGLWRETMCQAINKSY